MSHPSLTRQLTWGLLAQSYAQAVTIAVQLLVLPLMLWLWGAENYGAWLILSALPACLSMADLGFAQVAANDMTMRLARGDRGGARRVGHTAWLMAGLASLVALTGFAFVAFLMPLATLFGIAANHVPATAFILALPAILSIGFGVVGAGMRCVGLFGLVATTNASLRLVDALALVTAALCGGDLLQAAFALLAARLLVLVPIVGIFYHRHAWLVPGLAQADPALLRKMLAPSLAYLAYGLAHALNIQGATLLVGAVLGPTAVVVLSAIRTLTRLGRTAASIAIYALEPIFAQFAGHDGGPAAASTFRRLLFAMAIGLALYLFGMLLFGPQFLAWWTHGAVVERATPFQLLVAAICLEICWFTLQTPFVSTNRHSIFATAFLALSALGLVALWPALTLLGLDAAGWVAVVVHAAMLALTLALRRTLPILPVAPVRA